MTASNPDVGTRRRPFPPFGAVVGTTGPDLVLTFDDGPDPETTSRVLEVLERHRATATFFVLLTRARRHPEIVQHTVEAGHEIGLHGPDHLPLPSFPHRTARARTQAARVELETIVGRSVRWFRPPYGDQSTSSYLAARRAGLRPVMWSATTWDWKDVSQAERVEKALGGSRAGSIVLAHDGTADASDGATVEDPVSCDKVALLDELLVEWARRGLHVRSLGAALQSAHAVHSLRFAVPHRRPTR